MKEISIIIRANENRIIEYIKILEPILGDSHCEFIIINNRIESLNIKQDYTLYKFSGSSSKFKEFCFAAAIGKKSVIIDGDIQLTPELAEDIKVQLSSSDFNNIIYKFRKFLSNNRPLYYMDKNVLIYNRGIKGFNSESQIIIHDFTLLDEDSIDINLKKFMDKKSFKELYLWYKHSILEHLKEHRLYFYELLEKEKAELQEEEISVIEGFFLSCRMDEEYCRYLDIKRGLLIEGCMGPFIEKLNSLSSIRNEVFYSWILYKFFKDRKDLVYAVTGIKTSLLQDVISYLLGFEGFHAYLFDLIREINFTANMNEDIRLSDMNLLLIRSYLGFAPSLPLNPELKNRMIKLLEAYGDVLKVRETPDLSGYSFAKCLQRAHDYTMAGDINNAVLILKSLSSDYPVFERAIHYYIQRLRYKSDCYRHTLSICMIVRDEEKNLDRCLYSIKPLLDSTAELIIVDTGSIDKTIEIAKKYTEKIYFYKWQGNFSAARNYSLSLAEGEYIFLLDADEEIGEKEITKLLKYFKEKYYKLHSTCTLKVKNYTEVSLKEYAVITQPRVFRNSPEFYYSGKVHNQPVYELPVYHLPILITHYGYIMTKDIKDKKFERTANMLKLELQKNPKNIYYRFQLSTSYAMHGDLREALEQTEIYMNSIKEENILDDNYLMHFNNAVILYISSGQLDRASDICDEGLKIKQDFIDFIYFKVHIYYETEDYENALLYTNKYLDLIDRFMSLDISNDGRYSFYTLGMKKNVITTQILCQHLICDYDGVINTLESFREVDIKNCLHAIIHSYLMKKRYTDLIKLYKSNCLDEGSRLIFKYFLKNYSNKTLNIEDSMVPGILSTLDCLEGKKEECRNREITEEYQDKNEALYIIENYNIDSLSLSESRELFNKLLPAYNTYIVEKAADIKEVYLYKMLGLHILQRAAILSRIRGYSNEVLINILRKYMSLSSYLIMHKRTDLMTSGEQLFLVKVTDAFKKYGAGDYENSKALLNQAAEANKPMKGLIRILQRSVFPDFRESNHTLKALEVIKGSDKGIKTYANVIKERILEVAGRKSNHELLELFNQYKNKKLYDPELFSYKSLLLMSEGLLDEAEAELKEGLFLYKNDTRLLCSLARLYSLTKKYDKSLEAYCRAKLLSKGDCRLHPSELLPNGYSFSRPDNLRVLHGTMFADNAVNQLASQLIKGGIYARTLSYSPKYTSYTSDYCIDMNQYDEGGDILSRTLDAASYLIPRFDIFHFHYGNTLTFDYSDLPLLKELGKGVIVQFYGDEIKVSSTDNKHSIYKAKAETINTKLENLSKHIKTCIVPNEELSCLVKDYFKDIHIIQEGQTDRLIDLYESLD